MIKLKEVFKVGTLKKPLILLLPDFLSGLMAVSLVSADLSLVQVPPTYAGEFNEGEQLTLTFIISFAGSTDSRAIVSTSFDPSGWSYSGFIAKMDTIDVSTQFTETVGADSVVLEASDLNPDEGTLNVTLIFTAVKHGSYKFDWATAAGILDGQNAGLNSIDGTTNAVVKKIAVVGGEVITATNTMTYTVLTAALTLMGVVVASIILKRWIK